MYWEEFQPGMSGETPTRRITAQDVDTFIALSGLDLAMFQNDAGARARGHAARLVPGPLVLSVAMGLVRAMGWFDQVVAVAGFEDLRFLRPVHPGHSLQVRVRVLETRPTGHPDRGLVRLDYRGLDQFGQEVMRARGAYLMLRRPPA